MTSYLYILGRTPELSLTELSTFLPDITRIQNEVAGAGRLLPIERLGGTVKIAEVIPEISVSPKSTFGVSVYGGPKFSRQKLEEIKEKFQAHRFVEPRDSSVLSSVVIQKNRIEEIIIAGDIVARTVAVQPFEAWGQRDFGRPYADPRAGMLPPKVARMIVNIAGGPRDFLNPLSQKTLLDPFCGMGTILSEALVMGWNVYGGDISPEVLERARGNLRWLLQQHKAAEGVTYRLEASDAVHISEKLSKESVDAIVTEPYMGNPNIKGEKIKNTVRGLEKLYIGCLRDWHTVLKNNGRIVMALPVYAVNGKRYSVKKVIDMCEILGYTIVKGPLEYGRPNAVVKRNFYIFEKK